MSSINQLNNVPEVSFIENMTLQETEEQTRAEYLRLYKELTGKEGELTPADAKTLLIKAFSLIEYQTMQYIDAKGRAEMLKTSTGEALEALAALFGIFRLAATRAIATERFTLSDVRPDVVAIPAGTRVKTQNGRYFNTLSYAEIPAGDTYVDVMIQAEEAGTEPNDIPVGDINILVDPIAYVAKVENTVESTGGIDVETDNDLTERVYLAPKRFSVAGPKGAYEYYVREWRADVADVMVTSPTACHVVIYAMLEDGSLLTTEERASLLEYLSDENIRPLTDLVSISNPTEIDYEIDITYYIATSDRNTAGDIQNAVNKAVTDYKAWQRHLGRDINPTELIHEVRAAGAKRVVINNSKPADAIILNTQLPKCVATTVTYGGLEDD